MDIVDKNFNIGEFKKYVDEFDFGSIPPTKLVIHHTWKPTRKDWEGRESIFGLKNYYEGKGWPAGPHLFIAGDGIWSLTSMYNVGIHAGAGNATYKHRLTGKRYRGHISAFSAYIRKFLRLENYSIGIEVVGDYDVEQWEGKTRHNTFGAIKILMNRLGLKNEDIQFHRDFSKKTCPGSAITKDWIFRELENYDDNGNFRMKPDDTPPAPWAAEAWQWFRDNHLCDTTKPTDKVDAQWIATMIFNSRKIK